MVAIAVIVGSTRENRFSEQSARWIFERLNAHSGVEAQWLDLREFPMPFFDQPATPAICGLPPVTMSAGLPSLLPEVLPA